VNIVKTLENIGYIEPINGIEEDIINSEGFCIKSYNAKKQKLILGTQHLTGCLAIMYIMQHLHTYCGMLVDLEKGEFILQNIKFIDRKRE